MNLASMVAPGFICIVTLLVPQFFFEFVRIFSGSNNKNNVPAWTMFPLGIDIRNPRFVTSNSMSFCIKKSDY